MHGLPVNRRCFYLSQLPITAAGIELMNFRSTVYGFWLSVKAQLNGTCTLLQGRWGPFLKPGTTLHDTLAAYFARDLIQDAVCTHCSLRATLQQAPISYVAVGHSRSGIAPTAVSSTPKDSEQDANMEDDSGVKIPRIASSEAASVSGQGGQGNSGGQAAAEKLARLQGLLRGSCAAPECDYAQLAREAGLDWEERRGPLLTRATIARSPQVRPLLLAPACLDKSQPGRCACLPLMASLYKACLVQLHASTATPINSCPVASLHDNDGGCSWTAVMAGFGICWLFFGYGAVTGSLRAAGAVPAAPAGVLDEQGAAGQALRPHQLPRGARSGAVHRRSCRAAAAGGAAARIASPGAAVRLAAEPRRPVTDAATAHLS